MVVANTLTGATKVSRNTKVCDSAFVFKHLQNITTGANQLGFAFEPFSQE